MTHTGLVSLTEIKGVKDVTTITQTDDHFLKDYVPFIQLKVKGRLSPEDFKILQGEKGQVILDVQCCIPTCPGEVHARDGPFTYISVTPINDAFEREMITAWVQDLKERLKE